MQALTRPQPPASPSPALSRHPRTRRAVACLLWAGAAWSSPVLAQAQAADQAPGQTTRAPVPAVPAPAVPALAVIDTPDSPPGPGETVRFEADKVTYDDNANLVTATGSVVLRRAAQTVRADAVTWNRKTGQIVGTGNIRFVDEDGDVLYTDRIELTDEFKAGATQDLLLVLREGGRLAARSTTRDNAGDMVLHDAVYSGCDVVDADGCPRRPSWEITAVRVTYRASDKRVKYYGAKLRVFGVPLLPLPGLGHTADFRAESGLLIPDFKLTSSNGAQLNETYYWRLDNNRDLALTGTLFSNALPMISGKYRQLTERGAYQVTGYLTRSRQTNATSLATGTNATNGDGQYDLRGYIEANGRFQFGDNWSLTGYGRYVSDRTFLRRYDLSTDDRLRSSINLERIDADSYFSLAGWAVQAIRATDVQGQVPFALPSLEYRRRLAVPRIGGKLELEINSLALSRSAGQNTQRALARAQWDLSTVTAGGQEITFTTLLRGDIYHSDKNTLTANTLYQGLPGWEARGIATAAVDIKWPLIGTAFGGTQVLTPRVQIVATPHIRNLAIPDEDSRSVELEDSNLFALNRYPGYDRVEDGVRVTYGLDWRLDLPGWRVSTTVGQSYRLSDQGQLVPDGTGLAARASDIVGRTELRFRDVVKLTHRFQLDKSNFQLRRNEFDLTVGGHRTYVELGYLALNRNIPATYEDLQDRKELRLSARAAFAHYWSVFGSGVANLTTKADDPVNGSNGFEVLRHRLGFAYTDGCLDLAFTWRRDYVTTGDAVRGNSYLLSLSLRNIGSR